MKKLNPSYLFYFAGILWIFAGIISEDMRWGYALGFALIALGIAKRIKDSLTEDSEEGEQKWSSINVNFRRNYIKGVNESLEAIKKAKSSIIGK